VNDVWVEGSRDSDEARRQRSQLGRRDERSAVETRASSSDRQAVVAHAEAPDPHREVAFGTGDVGLDATTKRREQVEQRVLGPADLGGVRDEQHARHPAAQRAPAGPVGGAPHGRYA
jgi:hypothetical protein